MPLIKEVWFYFTSWLSEKELVREMKRKKHGLVAGLSRLCVNSYL